MTPILNNILMRLGLLKSYRVHNELTGESFVVTGRSAKGCLHVANKICNQLGWDDEPPDGVCWSERELRETGANIGKTDIPKQSQDKPYYVVEADREEKEAWEAYLKAIKEEKLEKEKYNQIHVSPSQAFRRWSRASYAKIDAYSQWGEKIKEDHGQ